MEVWKYRWRARK